MNQHFNTWHWTKALLVFLLALAASVLCSAAQASLVIVSDRSSSVLVAGAHRYLDKKPQADIAIRTVSQVERLNDADLQQLLLSHHSLLLAGVFGESVERLLAMAYPRGQRRFVLHSDNRLMALQRDANGQPFSSVVSQQFVGSEGLALDAESLAASQQKFPEYSAWLQARAYWIHRSAVNVESLIALLNDGDTAPLREQAPLRLALHGKPGERWLTGDELDQSLSADKPIVWVLDHNTGDLNGEWALHRAICANQQWQCVSLLAAWGEPSVDAVDTIATLIAGKRAATPSVIISLQDFVVGGGEGRQAVLDALQALNLPVLKGLRVLDWGYSDWQLSAQGLPADSVHYRLAMPELQGIGQAQILSLASDSGIDPATGAKLRRSEVVDAELARQLRRVERWLALQNKRNFDKRIAIVYYNHPPGRHNIGADNLNVPDSLLEMLQALQSAGYHTGKLPESTEALLSLLQERGVNLPEDRQALAEMSGKVASLSANDYRKWFATLPKVVQQEMEAGPLGELHQRMVSQLERLSALQDFRLRQKRLTLLTESMHNTVTNLHHALDGVRQKSRNRALDLLEQLEREYQTQIDAVASGGQASWRAAEARVAALVALGIEGIRGWGDAPGKVMVWDERLLVPGVRFGNIFVGPQPPRGWELNEELLHANLSFPPPHQYLAFYRYLQNDFGADALVHVGRHSTYEFLPRRGVGLGEDDYPSIIAGDLPGVYPYIVDGVGEGIQAKRRGLAVMVDHLTPPLAVTELYDELLEVRQLVESAEAASDPFTRSGALAQLRAKIDEYGLRDELEASMDEELKVRGIGFEEIDEELFLHEVGHYLTHVQEDFMPLGLHVLGRDWSTAGVDTMLASMADSGATEAEKATWRRDLRRSPQAEMTALLNGLNGRFVAPGKGNDPIRTPEALPTGRNFHALDGSLIPSKLGYQVGRQLADQVLSGEQSDEVLLRENAQRVAAKYGEAGPANKQGVILWASDAVRDEGAMVAFGLKLLGMRPMWNSRGIVKGLERIELGEDQPRRMDVLFTASGLFRDLYGRHMALLDRAVLMALDASRDTIAERYPNLRPAVNAALALIEDTAAGGREPLEKNQVATNWVAEARAMLAAQPGMHASEVGRQASLRVFGIAPGGYGAGINRLVERSGAWQDRKELGEVYLKRMGHAFGVGLQGEAAQQVFREQLVGVSKTFLGRASNLYGLIDNNDAFDYLGGFNLAVETVTGRQPESAVINHARSDALRMDSLQKTLATELRGRFFNPQWIKPLMEEGYAGARTMGSEFVEYLWGWEVTSPELISDAVWNELKDVYIDDSRDLGLDIFLSEGDKRYVQTNILAVMLVSIDKGFWQAGEQITAQLAQQFASNIIEHGKPGSGHTHANHPMYELVKAQLSVERAAELEAVLARSRTVAEQPAAQPSTIREVQVAPSELAPDQHAEESSAAKGDGELAESARSGMSPTWYWLLAIVVVIFGVGIRRGLRANA
ncbi:cobaltochelatase subunit CobN [Spongiibacter marinus]|uniref:cobaltochelatase subunit CobN n=1 Tax=Spongiibacter marinus TaxID=354246 RepID=UPI0035BE99D2